MRILWVHLSPPAPAPDTLSATACDHAKAATAAEALACLRHVDADIVVSEILLPGLSGYELARRLAARTGAPPVLLCTRIAGTWPLPRAIRSGALGFVGRGEGPDALAEAICHVAGGGRLWGAPARGPQDDGIRDAGIEALTPRHFETLHLLLQGMDDAAVANAMNVTRRSAAANRRSVLSGLHISDAAQLTRVAPLIDDAFYAACPASARMVQDRAQE